MSQPIVNRIYVAGLDGKVSSAELRTYFETFGEMTDVYVPNNHQTGQPKHFGFVTFADTDSAASVLAIASHEIKGQTVELKPCVPKDQIAPKGFGKGGAGPLDAAALGAAMAGNPALGLPGLGQPLQPALGGLGMQPALAGLNLQALMQQQQLQQQQSPQQLQLQQYFLQQQQQQQQLQQQQLLQQYLMKMQGAQVPQMPGQMMPGQFPGVPAPQTAPAGGFDMASLGLPGAAPQAIGLPGAQPQAFGTDFGAQPQAMGMMPFMQFGAPPAPDPNQSLAPSAAMPQAAPNPAMPFTWPTMMGSSQPESSPSAISFPQAALPVVTSGAEAALPVLTQTQAGAVQMPALAGAPADAGVFAAAPSFAAVPAPAPPANRYAPY